MAITIKPKNTTDPQQQDVTNLRLVNTEEATALFGVSRPTFTNKISKLEGFPAPIQLPGFKPTWRLADLLDYQERYRQNA